jgi:hypothetical protein
LLKIAEDYLQISIFKATDMSILVPPDFLRALTDSVDLLDGLNTRHPNLASTFTKETVVRLRRLLGTIEVVNKESHSGSVTLERAQPKEKGEESELANAARELLQEHSLDDALEILQKERQADLTLAGMVDLVGKEAYIGALQREIADYRANAISIDQIAELWNDFGRPPLGDAAWNSISVSALM